MIERYLGEYEKLRPLGKTKRATLNAIKESSPEVRDAGITSSDWLNMPWTVWRATVSSRHCW